ncbi:MAG: DNA-binding protein WhiA [Oscillospiraceae bacterium]
MSELSFSQQVKEEILSKINSSAKADACLFGLLLCINTLTQEQISMQTESKTVADFFELNVNRICGADSVSVTCKDRRGKQLMYNISVSGEEKCSKLMSYFSIDENRVCHKQNYPKQSLYPLMIAGMFLSCGSLSDPNKGYHMEFVMPDLTLCNSLGLLLLEKFEMLAKHVERKNHQILYFKESEHIIDMVALMGATTSSFDLMNVKIYKDMKNKINREVNCVNANIEKAIRAGEKQIEDIELIDEVMGIGSLPDNLKEIAMLRYDNPDFTLNELGAALDPPISRSGANHRLKKIAQIADEIREKKKI